MSHEKAAGTISRGVCVYRADVRVVFVWIDIRRDNVLAITNIFRAKIVDVARANARHYAIMTEEQLKSNLGDPYPTETNPKDLENSARIGSFYNVTQKVWVETKTDEDTNKTTLEDVVVEVEFARNNDDLPNVLNWMGWPPEKLRPLYYRMRIEQDIVISSGEAANT